MQSPQFVHLLSSTPAMLPSASTRMQSCGHTGQQRLQLMHVFGFHRVVVRVQLPVSYARELPTLACTTPPSGKSCQRGFLGESGLSAEFGMLENG